MKTALRASAPAFVAASAVLVYRGALPPPSQTYGGGDRFAYARTQIWVWLHYLRLFVLPVGLSADTDLALIPVWYDTRVLAGVCALARARLGGPAAARGAARLARDVRPRLVRDRAPADLERASRWPSR